MFTSRASLLQVAIRARRKSICGVVFTESLGKFNTFILLIILTFSPRVLKFQKILLAWAEA